MSINFNDIKKNFFIEYLKYWIVFFAIICLYLLTNIFRYFFSTDRITMDIDNAIYITSGVAVNEKYVIADKNLIESSCIGPLSGLRGTFYIVDKNNIYPAVIDRGDSISNMVLLRLKNNENNLSSYAILQMNSPRYIINRRFFIPITINKPGFFNFKKARIVALRDKDYFVALKSSPRRDSLAGFPVFNKNYVLQGIIRGENSNYNNIGSRDNFLNKVGIQKTFLVNGIDTIKAFLDRFRIEYSVIDGNVNLNNKTYNAKDSVVNIICIKIY